MANLTDPRMRQPAPAVHAQAPANVVPFRPQCVMTWAEQCHATDDMGQFAEDKLMAPKLQREFAR
jgi:hypothetical protein